MLSLLSALTGQAHSLCVLLYRCCYYRVWKTPIRPSERSFRQRMFLYFRKKWQKEQFRLLNCFQVRQMCRQCLQLQKMMKLCFRQVTVMSLQARNSLKAECGDKRSDCESYFHSGFPFGYFLFFLICLILITFITIPAVTNSDRTAINIRLFVLSGLSSCACTSLVTGE